MNPLSAFRLVSLIEGISYLVLVLIAMPLKYLADLPLAVRIVGMAHGVLFLLFVISMFRAGFERDWRVGRWVTLFLASLVPFGFIYIEKQLKIEQQGAASD